MRSIFFFLFLFLFSSFIVGDIQTLPSASISIDGTIKQIEAPLVLIDNISYFPVAELRQWFPVTISKSSKSNSMTLSFKKNTLTIVKYSRECWLNGLPHFFSSPSRYVNSSLYIPTTDLFSFLGYDVSQVNQSFFIKTKPSSTLVSGLPNTTTLDRFQANKNRFPNLSPSEETFISYQNKKVNLMQKFFWKNDICYIYADELLNVLDYTLTYSSTSLIISNNGYSYTIPFDSRQWNASYKDYNWHLFSESTVQKKEDRYYIPFSSLMALLDYSVVWDFKTQTLNLLANIHGIQWNTSTSNTELSILSRHVLYSQYDTPQKWKHGDIIDIPFSYIVSPISQKNKDHDIVKSLRLSAISKHISRLKIHYLDTSISAFILPSSSHLSLSFNTHLKKLNYAENSQTHVITFLGSDELSPAIWSDKHKLVLDFNHTINELPWVRHVDSHSLKSIRASQFKTSPLITRVVLDFKNTVPSYKTNKKNNEFSIIVPKVPITTTTKAIAQVKKPKLQKKKTSKSKKTKKITTIKTKGLQNKVIIVDAGHGGHDPGAVVFNSYYEKKYTLDIARKLQQKLKNEGAYVIMTRSGDTNPSLRRRSLIANNNNADLFISIHLNSFTSSKANGSETYYYKYKDKKLALHVQKQLKKDLSIKSNGIKRNRFYVLRHTKMPSVLVETLFLTNKNDRELVKTSSFRSKVAGSIFQGIKNYFNDV